MIEDSLIGESSANKEKYQEFQIKLDQSKKLEPETNELEPLFDEAEEVYTSLKMLEGPTFFKKVNVTAALIGSLAAMVHFFLLGTSLGIIVVCLTILGLIVNKVLIGRKIQETSKFKNLNVAKPVKKEQLVQFFHYVKNGIELKEIRFIMLSLILGISFTSLCLVAGDIFFNPSGFLEIGMAILAGILFVYALFVKDLFALNRMKSSISKMIADVAKL